ncbi:MAG: amino acid ABC transporter substrate-binding protein [Firmicutes bacterium]|nr:amino acid ABC transporter substrate-binding protein [Bacillota bacterium]
MKKVLALVLALVIGCSSALLGCTGSSKTKVIVGVDNGFPPMGFLNDQNELVGFDIDVAKVVFEKLGMEVEFLAIDWNAKEQELNTKKVDCLWNGYTITDERKEKVNFSDPYMKNAQVVVVKKDSGYTSLSDLAGKKLALQSGSSAADALEEAADFKASLGGINEFGDNMKAFMDLEAGMSDAVLLDQVVADYYIKSNNKDWIVLDEKLALEEYGVGFRKDDPLRDKVNDTLKELAADGTLAKISTEWFGADVTTIGK